MQDTHETWKKHRIDATLNNCSMNAGLSLMLWDIAKLAEIEGRGQLPEQLHYIDDETEGAIESKSGDTHQSLGEVSPNDHIYQSYKLLKQIFSNIYGATPDELSWQELNTIINRQDTFIGKQLLFLEVFRKFIGHTAENHHSEEYPDKRILTELQVNYPFIPPEDQCTGRFTPLAGSQVYQLFYAYFGISIEVYEQPQSTTDNTSWNKNETQCGYYPPSAEQQRVNSWACPDRLLKLYIDGGHFELLHDKDLEEAEISYALEKSLLNRNRKLHARFNEFSESGDYLSSKVGLIKLRYYLYSEIQSMRGQNVDDYVKRNMVTHILNLCSSDERYKCIAYQIQQLQPLSDGAINEILEAKSLTTYFERFETAKVFLSIASTAQENEQAINAIKEGLENNDGSSSSHVQNPLINQVKYVDAFPPPANSHNVSRVRHSVSPTNNPQSHSLAFKLFTSIYAKLFMTLLFLAAALTLTALLINTSYLPTAISTFIIHLAPAAYNALFGASIAVTTASGVGLLASTTLSNCDSCLFNRKDEIDSYRGADDTQLRVNQSI